MGLGCCNHDQLPVDIAVVTHSDNGSVVDEVTHVTNQRCSKVVVYNVCLF